MNGILIAVLIVTGLLITKLSLQVVNRKDTKGGKPETAVIRKILPIQKLPVKDGSAGTLVLLLR